MCSSMKSIKCLMAATTLLLGACGDERATMVENSTGTSALALAEIMEPSVDLLVGDALLTERALEPNQIVRVDATVVNRGGRAADKSQLRYLLSDDGVWDQGDTYLNYDAVPSLDPGELAREYANLRVPADWPYGAAYILIVADAKRVLEESQEANNVLALSVEIVERNVPNPEDLPELGIQNASLSSSVALQGALVEASVEVVNQGLADAETSQARYYISASPTLDSNAIYLNYDRVGSLGASEIERETANLRIPSDLESGSFFILFVADAKSVIEESDETNNVVARPISIGEEAVLGTPDLAVTSLVLSTMAHYPGEPLTAVVQIQNVGDGLSDTRSIRFYLSSDSVVDADDIEIGSDTIEPLGPNASREEVAQLFIHASTRVGTYRVLALIDSPDDDAITDEPTNNLRHTELSLSKDRPSAPLPDLVLENIVLSSGAALQGDVLQIQLEVTNRGVQPAQASRLKYYLSSRNLYDSSADYLNYDAVAVLEPMESGSENANLRIPANLSDGTYFILVVADDTDVVAESIESNNVVALPIGVGPSAVLDEEGDENTSEEAQDKPDLVAIVETVPTRDYAPGERVPTSVLISNIGTNASTDCRVKYFISRDPIYDAFDKYGGYDRVGALQPGEVSPETGNPRVPADAHGGLWYILVVTDANNDVDEMEEENNVLAIPFMVDVDTPEADLPDLAIESVVLGDERLQPNAQAELQFSLVNQGTQSATGSRLKFYWSEDEHYDAQDRFLDYRRIPALNVSETFEVEATLRVPLEAAFGAAYILIVLDVEGRVPERFESNNVYPQLLTVDALGSGEAPPAFGCPSDLTMDPTIDRDHTIGSMNVLHMGWDNGKDYGALACVLSHFAISALNEVESEDAMGELERALEATTQEAWSYHISPREVGNKDGSEYYAFIWRDARVSFLGGVGFFDDPNDVIKRDPYGANFQMDDFDFTLVAFHQRNGGSIAARRAEAVHFADIVSFFQAANGEEDDLIIGGDFNLPGNDPAFTAVGWNGVTYSVDHEQATSISDTGLRNSFDNLFYQEQFLTEVRSVGVLDFTRGNHADLRWRVSDHIPVWMTINSVNPSEGIQ